VLSSVVYPTLYLAAMGVGLGGLVTRHTGGAPASLGGVSYLAFVAPGVLAATSMQIAVNEASYPVMSAIRWQRSYLAMLATPLGVIDVLRGHLAWIATRLFLTVGAFVAIAAAFGALVSPEAILAVPAGVLAGLAFALPTAAFSAGAQNDAGFSTLNRLVIVPLFLFSGSFFPVHELPAALRVLAEFTPLYHGVALCRAATLGHLWQLSTLGHVAYLVGVVALSARWAMRAYLRRLAR
jgi:lipooligosaccharide transport system permease protein